MKIRTGFVSNSSSASFIIRFKTSLSYDDIATYIKKTNDWIASRWDEDKREKVDWKNLTKKKTKPKFEKCTPFKDEFLFKTNDGWEIHPSTTMFNDWTDVPAWPFIRAINEGRIDGIELEKIIKTEEEYEDCLKEDGFNIHCWSWDYLEREDEPEENKKETLEKEEEIKYEYMSYLHKVGVTLTEEEERYLAKNYLVKF